MSSINQLVSEIAHSLKQPDSIPVRRAIKLAIIHARNTLIRVSYNNNRYTDKGLQQRFKVTLTDVPDGDLFGTNNLRLGTIKRSVNPVPKPTRLTNNLPFHRVSSVGRNAVEIAYVKEVSSQYYSQLPGFCKGASYDYVNGYVYVYPPVEGRLADIGAIVIESVFEYPHLIPTETNEGITDNDNDDNEFLIPEDMIGDLKKLVLETWNPQFVRDTNEVTTPNKIH